MNHSNVDNKILQILQPYRTLADNWNINIASELEQYLNELQSISFSIDDGKTSIDFVTAALLIQGSTQVFARKVTYLFDLSIQTIEKMISSGEGVISKELQLQSHNDDDDDDDLDDITFKGQNPKPRNKDSAITAAIKKQHAQFELSQAPFDLLDSTLVASDKITLDEDYIPIPFESNINLSFANSHQSTINDYDGQEDSFKWIDNGRMDPSGAQLLESSMSYASNGLFFSQREEESSYPSQPLLQPSLAFLSYGFTPPVSRASSPLLEDNQEESLVEFGMEYESSKEMDELKKDASTSVQPQPTLLYESEEPIEDDGPELINENPGEYINLDMIKNNNNNTNIKTESKQTVLPDTDSTNRTHLGDTAAEIADLTHTDDVDDVIDAPDSAAEEEITNITALSQSSNIQTNDSSSSSSVQSPSHPQILEELPDIVHSTQSTKESGFNSPQVKEEENQNGLSLELEMEESENDQIVAVRPQLDIEDLEAFETERALIQQQKDILVQNILDVCTHDPWASYDPFDVTATSMVLTDGTLVHDSTLLGLGEESSEEEDESENENENDNADEQNEDGGEEAQSRKHTTADAEKKKQKEEERKQRRKKRLIRARIIEDDLQRNGFDKPYQRMKPVPFPAIVEPKKAGLPLLLQLISSSFAHTLSSLRNERIKSDYIQAVQTQQRRPRKQLKQKKGNKESVSQKSSLFNNALERSSLTKTIIPSFELRPLKPMLRLTVAHSDLLTSEMLRNPPSLVADAPIKQNEIILDDDDEEDNEGYASAHVSDILYAKQVWIRPRMFVSEDEFMEGMAREFVRSRNVFSPDMPQSQRSASSKFKLPTTAQLLQKSRTHRNQRGVNRMDNEEREHNIAWTKENKRRKAALASLISSSNDTSNKNGVIHQDAINQYLRNEYDEGNTVDAQDTNEKDDAQVFNRLNEMERQLNLTLDAQALNDENETNSRSFINVNDDKDSENDVVDEGPDEFSPDEIQNNLEEEAEIQDAVLMDGMAAIDEEQTKEDDVSFSSNQSQEQLNKEKEMNTLANTPSSHGPLAQPIDELISSPSIFDVSSPVKYSQTADSSSSSKEAGDELLPDISKSLVADPITDDILAFHNKASAEQLYRKHINDFLEQSKQWRLDDTISNNVQRWHNIIIPRLQEASKRKNFDMIDYCLDLISSIHSILRKEQPSVISEIERNDQTFSESDNSSSTQKQPPLVDLLSPIPFSRLVGGQPHFEMLRRFASFLQLVNRRVVSIKSGSTPNSLEITAFAGIRAWEISVRLHSSQNDDLQTQT